MSLPELGNVFMGCDDWRPRYQRLLNAAGEVLTERLRALPLPVCLLCAERQASAGQREVTAAYLVQRGYDIEHLLSVLRTAVGNRICRGGFATRRGARRH